MKKIYCVQCEDKMPVVLQSGDAIYKSLKYKHLNFWVCGGCNNYVGVHKNSPTHEPLGIIPTPEVRNARQHIHAILDPIHQKKLMKRREVYDYLSEKLGWQYHTAKIKNVEEARKIYIIIKELKAKLHAR